MLDMAEWDTSQVLRWLEGLGLHTYSDDFKYHRITGDSLMVIDHDDLEEVGVRSFGHRVRLLTAINQHLKRPGANLSHKTTADLAQEVADLKLRVQKLTESHNRTREDMLPIIRRAKENMPLPSPTHVQQSAPPTSRRGHSTSPSTEGPLELSSRTSSRLGTTTPLAERPNRLGLIEEDPDPLGSIGSQPSSLLSGPQVVHTHVKNGAPIALSTASEPFKSFRVTLDDPCTKILPAVLKKYRIHDDPSNYRLLVSYGDRERELRNDEKPLHVFKELQDSGLRPVFMVRQVVKSSSLTPSGRVTPGGVI